MTALWCCVQKQRQRIDGPLFSKTKDEKKGEAAMDIMCKIMYCLNMKIL